MPWDREPQPGDGPDYHADHASWAERQGMWWRQHEAYQAIQDALGDGINNRPHLAFLLLTGLRRAGWAIVRKDGA